MTITEMVLWTPLIVFTRVRSQFRKIKMFFCENRSSYGICQRIRYSKNSEIALQLLVAEEFTSLIVIDSDVGLDQQTLLVQIYEKLK